MTRHRHGRRVHIGSCQVCNEVRRTRRVTLKGVRAEDHEVGRWLCDKCWVRLLKQQQLVNDAMMTLREARRVRMKDD